MKDEPLVLCLTNTVAANFTANVLLAIGAKPAMIEEPCEAEQLASMADAVLINLGTVTERQAEAMRRAIAAAKAAKVPWVLDPVAAHVLDFRKRLAKEFLALKPDVVRGNQPEIAAFADCIQPPTVSLATGKIDVIADEDVELEIPGGSEMLTQVTATGCAQGAIVAAFLGQGDLPFSACETASRLMKKASEHAARRANERGVGSFQVALLDGLWKHTHD